MTMKHFLLSALMMLSVGSAFAQAPRTLSYQGFIVDASNEPIGGTHQITVKLYDVPNGGTAMHTETFTAPVTTGLFSVTLGSTSVISQLVGFDKQYWIGVTIDGGTEMTPRTVLTSAPYALHAASIAPTAAVTSLNDLTGQVTLEGTGGTTVTKNGSKITINSVAGGNGGVPSVNGQTGAITLQGGGGTTVTNVGGIFTISSSGGGASGIAGVQSSDGSIAITNSNGPTATLNVADKGVTTSKLADAAVGTTQISDNAITSAKIGVNQVTGLHILGNAITDAHVADAALSASKLKASGASNGQVLKYNGANWAPASDNGLVLPYTGVHTGATDAMQITINNNNNSNGALNVATNGSGYAISGTSTGTGSAGIYRIQNAANGAASIVGSTNGTGKAGDFLVSNASNSSPAVFAQTDGTGSAGYFFGSKTSSPNAALTAKGNSDVFFARADGATGSAGIFRIYNANSASEAFTVSHAGTGSVASFSANNASDAANAVTITHNGTGTGLDATAAALGVHGLSNAATGSNSGVVGEVMSTSHGQGANAGVSGILGKVTPTTPGGYSAGVRGVNNGTGGTGIGVIGFQNGSGWGVYGETPSGFGVYGLTTNNTAVSSGVRGETFSTNGIGVEAKYSGTGVGVALELDNGAIRVSGVNKAAFVHTATVANKIDANGTDIDNAMCNGDANCILIVTQKMGAGVVYNNNSIGVFYNANRSKWTIFNENAANAVPTGAMFNVLVIKQ